MKTRKAGKAIRALDKPEGATRSLVGHQGPSKAQQQRDAVAGRKRQAEDEAYARSMGWRD